jgi:hypothetical protein
MKGYIIMGHAHWLLQYLTSGVHQSRFYPKFIQIWTNSIEHAINEVDKHVYFIHVLERQIIINIVMLVSESFVLFIQFVSCNMYVCLRISLCLN